MGGGVKYAPNGLNSLARLTETMITKDDHQTIIKLIKTETLQQIGDRYGVSRERIRQILRKYDVPTPRRIFIKPCITDGCPNTISKAFDWARPLCSSCVSYQSLHKNRPEMRRTRRNFEMGTCERVGCTRKMRAGGLCNSHTVADFARRNPEYARKQREANNRRNKKRYREDPEFRDYILDKGRKWRKNNRERVNEYQRMRYRNKKTYEYLRRYYLGL